MVVDAGGHISTVTAVAFTRDGKYVVSASHDKSIRIWDLATGRTTRTIRGWRGDFDEGQIYAMAISPDDQYLAVGGVMGRPTEHTIYRSGGRGGSSYGGTRYTYEHVNAIRIFDFQTGVLLKTLEGSDGRVVSLTFSPTTNHLISGDTSGHISVWAVSPVQMKRVLKFNKHKLSIKKIEAVPGTNLIASLDSDVLKLWDQETGVVIKSWGRQKSLAVSSDGRRLASASEDDRILLWNSRDGEFERELARFESDVSLVSFAANDTKLVMTSGNARRVLSVSSGQLLAEVKDTTGLTSTAAMSFDGQLVASPLTDHTILIWNPDNAAIVRKFGETGMPFYAAGFAKDGRAIAFGRTAVWKGLNDRGPLEGAFRFAQGDSYKITLESKITSSDFLRATGETNDLIVRPKDSSRNNILQIIKSGKIAGEIKTGASPSCYTVTRNGRYIVVGTFSGNIEVYASDTPKLAFIFGRKARDLIGHEDTVWSVAASPDGRSIVSASDDHTLRVWDIESAKNILTMFVGLDNEWVAWTPEGYYTSSLNGDKYLGWHAKNDLEKAADFYSAAQFSKQYYRPGVVAEYLKSRDMKLALQQDTVATISNTQVPEPDVPPAGPVVDINTIVPPVIFLASPENDDSIVDDEFLTIRAEAKAADNTPPVSEVKVFLNGTEVMARKYSQPEVRFEVKVQLQSGDNSLSIIAQNDRATSRPTKRKIHYTGKSRIDKLPNLRILAIGISKYKAPSLALKFADRDALEFESLLKEQGKLQLLFNRVDTKIILNEEATRKTIIDGLDWLSDRSEVKQGDFLLLFLSGHGGVSSDNYYFYTHDHDPDANPEKDDVRWSILLDGLTQVPGTKPILFVDTCRAGAATGVRTKGDEGLVQALKDLKHNYKGVVFFAASSRDEKSVEVDSLQHGAFTYVLLEGLRGKADVLTADGIIYVNELGNWTRQRVRIVTNDSQNAIYDEPDNFMPFPLIALPRPSSGPTVKKPGSAP